MATEAVIFQQIVDINWDQAIYTASPNNTINVAQFAAKGSGTNIGIALTPKGNGYISAQVPDGTAAGGNARGIYSVDLQSIRQTATQVASGAYSTIAGGFRNTASGTHAFAAGDSNIASGGYSIAGGRSCTASGTESVALGQSAQATASGSVAIGISATASGAQSYSLGQTCTASAENTLATGNGAVAHFSGMRAHGGANIAAGAAQEVAFALSGKTTTNVEVILFMRAAFRAVLRTNSVWTGILHITGAKSDGSAIARYHRQVAISRVGSATALVGGVVAIGTDIDAGTSINITADDTNEALSVGVTGIASETWRWVAVFHGAELVIGT
jgi:hypothetical protein